MRASVLGVMAFAALMLASCQSTSDNVTAGASGAGDWVRGLVGVFVRF